LADTRSIRGSVSDLRRRPAATLRAGRHPTRQAPASGTSERAPRRRWRRDRSSAASAAGGARDRARRYAMVPCEVSRPWRHSHRRRSGVPATARSVSTLEVEGHGRDGLHRSCPADSRGPHPARREPELAFRPGSSVRPVIILTRESRSWRASVAPLSAKRRQAEDHGQSRIARCLRYFPAPQPMVASPQPCQQLRRASRSVPR
jgi:hypothetical protein